MRKTSIFFAIVFAVWHSPGETRAESIATCQAYVAEAVAAAKEVRERGCGDGGLDLNHPQWSTDPNVHMRWCRGADEDLVKDERNNRQMQVGHCRRCETYTFESVTLAGTVRTLQCGFNLDHPLWSEDRKVHMAWCMASRPDTAADEMGHRHWKIGLCQRCQSYGNLARDQAVEAEKLKCRGATGPRWGTSKEAHVSWCVDEFDRTSSFGSPERPRTNKESDARSGALARCKQEAKASQGLKKGAAAAVPYTAVPRKKETAETKPVQAARKPAEQPYAAKQKAGVAGGGSSAMDRLGGGGSSGTAGGAGTASTGKPRGGASVAAPASSASGGAGAGGGGGGGAAATTINRNAIGGGGSPERVR